MATQSAPTVENAGTQLSQGCILVIFAGLLLGMLLASLLAKPNLVTASNIPTFTSSGATVGGYAAGSTFDSVMHDLATRGGGRPPRSSSSPPR